MIKIFLIVFLIFIVGCSSIYDCGEDLQCFKEHSKDCQRTRVNAIYEENDVRITTRGLTDEGCRVSLKIEQISQKLKEEYPIETRNAEGKTLNCILPVKSDYAEEILNLEETFNRACSGPVKVALQGPLKDILRKV